MLLRLSGQIGSGKGSAISSSKPLNLQNYESQLERCFKKKSGAVAILLEVNSPGGSPAQSSLLHSRLLYHKKKYPDAPPVHAFCTDVCASGGYYIASACDEIHVLPSTIIGSVGVVSPSLGFVEFMRKYGIEDRTMHAGKSKIGDHPLAPRNPEAILQKTAILSELHEDFMAKVVAGRGDKLKHAAAVAYQREVTGESEPWSVFDLLTFGLFKGVEVTADHTSPLFDGSVYTGVAAVQLGLADSLYEDMEEAVKEKFGEDVRIKELKPKPSITDLVEELSEGGLKGAGASFAEGALSHVNSALVEATTK